MEKAKKEILEEVKEKKEKLKKLSMKIFIRKLVSNENYLRIKIIYYKLLDIFYLIRFKIIYGRFDFFNHVVIETTTYCNQRCSYCPNSKYDRGLLKNKKLMDEVLFKKIIDELQNLNYKGKIYLYLYGEPLSDERIPYFISYIKERLPKSYVGISTNGTFLTVQLYKELIRKGVDIIVYSQHNINIPEGTKEVKEYLKQKNKKESKFVHTVISGDVIKNRAGEIPDRLSDPLPRCTKKDRIVVIDYSGKVILCCNDYHSSIVFGDLNKEKLIDIYDKENYKKIREELSNRDFRLNLCKKCVGEIE